MSGDQPQPLSDDLSAARSARLCGEPTALRGATLTPYLCPVCLAEEDPACLYCTGTGLARPDQVEGWPADRVREVPRPPAVRRAPCGDCAFLAGSPETDADPDLTGHAADQPFFCHQGMPEAYGGYQPAMTWGGLPLGYLVCAGWWDYFTRNKIHDRRYIELAALRAARETALEELPPEVVPSLYEPDGALRRAMDEALASMAVTLGEHRDRLVRRLFEQQLAQDVRDGLSPEQTAAVLRYLDELVSSAPVTVSLREEGGGLFERPTGYTLEVTWPASSPAVPPASILEQDAPHVPDLVLRHRDDGRPAAASGEEP